METATTGTANHSAGTDNRCRGAACDPRLAGIHDTGHRRSDRARAAAVTNRLWRQRVDHTVGVRHQLAHVASIRIPVTMNGKQANFIMDTGANLSTLSESEAKKIIKLLERISNQLSTISEDVAYVVSREKARDRRQDEEVKKLLEQSRIGISAGEK